MPGAQDIETQYEEVELEPHDPLLPKTPQASSHRRSQSSELIELDDIPPIIKSSNGNIFWADEQCTRRVGLTSTEARLFLKLLQTEEPENYNYDEYKDMFDDFGREQKKLQELVDALPWWKLDKVRQKVIWEARIEWLKRMEGPRAWLLYLMARRRRILQQATVRVRERLLEKRRARIAGENVAPLAPERGRAPLVGVENPGNQNQLANPVMLSDTTQTSQHNLETIPSRPTTNKPENAKPVMVSDAVQTEMKLDVVTRIRDSLSASKSRGGRSRSSNGRCPVFINRLQATRDDIKRQVEDIMPKQQPYIVIGWFLRASSDPHERILQFELPEQLFIALRHGEISVRGWRRFLSLKALRGFGLYKCDISKGAHKPLPLTPSQLSILSQLYFAYRASLHHPDPDVARAWAGWIHKNLNNHKNNPLEGRYSLQLVYDWSSYRLCTIVAIPLLLSLAIGFWYMNGRGDVVTAWTLALYVVTAAAALIALMAIIGSLKDM